MISRSAIVSRTLVGHFDADRCLSRQTVDADRFRLQGQRKIVRHAGDFAVFDAGFGFEFKRGYHGSGMNLGDCAVDREFRQLARDDF